MKKFFFLMLITSSLTFSHGTEVHLTDGTAGASLNEQTTISKYKQLSKLSSEAIRENDWLKKEFIYDEIEFFLNYINSYNKLSSKKAKKNVIKYNIALKKRLIALNKVNGLGGKKVNQKQLNLRYDYVSKLCEASLKTGEEKEKAKKEINELVIFIKKWKSSQEPALQKILNKMEKSLQSKLSKLENQTKKVD